MMTDMTLTFTAQIDLYIDVTDDISSFFSSLTGSPSAPTGPWGPGGPGGPLGPAGTTVPSLVSK